MKKPMKFALQPGPNAEPWIKRFRAAIAMSPRFSTAWQEADGVYMTDLEGDRYMTFLASAHNLGYQHPAIIAAAKAQIEKTGVGRLRGVNPTLVAFAERLKEIAPPTLSEGRMSLCNTGSDAAGFAMDLARAYTGKLNVLAHFGAHHGYGAAQPLTSDRASHRRFSIPLMPGIIHVPYPNCYRCNFGQEHPGCDFLCIEHIRYVLATVSPPEETAAFFVEPISSQSLAVPPEEYFPMLQEICEEHEILLVDDEALTGYGRTGEIWAITHWVGIKPDIMFMAKATSNGIPIAIVLATKEIMDKEEFMQTVSGGTYAGNLLACACGVAHIDVLQRENLTKKAAEIGHYMQRRLKAFAEAHDIVGDVRGKGLLMGIEMVKNSKSKRPAPEAAARTVTEAFKRKLLIGAVGTYGQILRLLPPLILTKEEAEKAVTIIENALSEAERHIA